MIKVLLADDHTLVRQGLKAILDKTSDIAIMGEAEDGSGVLEEVSKQNFDIILLDISMPGRSGVDILKQLQTMKPAIKVLMLSMHPEERFALRCLRSGASGYLSKKSAPTELAAAIRKVAEGGKYVSPSLAEALASDLVGSERPQHELLTNREFEIMCMLANGQTVSQIGRELSLSTSTVSTHRKHIMKKMRLKTNSELTYYCFQNQLIS